MEELGTCVSDCLGLSPLGVVSSLVCMRTGVKVGSRFQCLNFLEIQYSG